jgi:hypothetical protein
LETDSLTVELTPLRSLLIADFLIADLKSAIDNQAINNYFTSLCGVCLRQRRQNFLNSSRSVVVFRFLVVE